MSNEGPVPRRDIDATTAARLAEIFAVAERAARSVIDEAEEEALARIDAAQGEADRIVAARLAGLAALTEEVDAQAESLRIQAEALQGALARMKAEIGGAPSPLHGATAPYQSSAASPSTATPALTVVGETPERPTAAPPRAEGPAERAAAGAGSALPDARSMGNAAGARLLATQMAVAGSSRAEIDARLRDGFDITDTGPILDAILGPER